MSDARLTSRATARAQIRAGMIATGCDASSADRVTDVAMHAAEEALAAIIRVTNALDGSEWVNSYSFALQLFSHEAAGRMKDLQQRVVSRWGEKALSTVNVDTRQ